MIDNLATSVRDEMDHGVKLTLSVTFLEKTTEKKCLEMGNLQTEITRK